LEATACHPPPVFQEVLNHSMGPGRKSIGLAKIGGGPSLARAGCNPTSKQILRTASPGRQEKQGTFAAESRWKRGRYLSKTGGGKIFLKGKDFFFDSSIFPFSCAAAAGTGDRESCSGPPHVPGRSVHRSMDRPFLLCRKPARNVGSLRETH